MRTFRGRTPKFLDSFDQLHHHFRHNEDLRPAPERAAGFFVPATCAGEICFAANSLLTSCRASRGRAHVFEPLQQSAITQARDAKNCLLTPSEQRISRR
jgi:hypothetical protein